MARTQAADYADRQGAIVEKAADLFARSGFRGASIADLALACGASKSLVYHYYPSKEDILYAVMASHIDQLEGDVAEVMALPGLDPRARLHALVRRFMAHYVGAASRQKVLLNELDQLPADKRARIVRQQRGIVAAVAGLMAAIDPALAGDAARTHARAMMLFGMINWTHTWYDPAGPLGPAAIADMAFALATGGGDQAS